VEERPSPAVLVALGAGVCGAVQPKINAVLGDRIGSGIVAALVNFAVALVCVVIALAFRAGTRRQVAAVLSWDVPRWTLTAGLGGAVVVLAGVVTVQTIGVAIFSVAFFSGQISFGLLADRLGVGAGGPRPISIRRVGASGLALLAVVLTQLGRQTGEFAPALVALVVLAGAAAALQAAFNGRITSVIGDPVGATAVNVVVGAVALGAVTGVLALTGTIGALDWPTEPWLYTGGALGVTIVLSLAIAAAALGVLSTTLAMLAAQLIGAFVVDWTTADATPTVGVLAGSALIVVAVALVGRQPARVPMPVGDA
jgi:bacterial/archaeal transporter family-2 protein